MTHSNEQDIHHPLIEQNNTIMTTEKTMDEDDGDDELSTTTTMATNKMIEKIEKNKMIETIRSQRDRRRAMHEPDTSQQSTMHHPQLIPRSKRHSHHATEKPTIKSPSSSSSLNHSIVVDHRHEQDLVEEATVDHEDDPLHRGPHDPVIRERRVSRAGSSRRNRPSAVNRGQGGSSNPKNNAENGDGGGGGD